MVSFKIYRKLTNFIKHSLNEDAKLMQLHICRYYDFIQNLDGVKDFLKARNCMTLEVPSLKNISKGKRKALEKKAYK